MHVTSGKIFEQLGIKGQEEILSWESIKEFGKMPEGPSVSKGEILFPRLDVEKEIQALEEIFAPKEEAAAKFLKFITSPEAMELWLKNVGELPANPTLAAQYNDDPIYGPFLQGLEYANSTFFVDEAAQRNVIVDAFDKVYLEGQSPDTAIDEAAAIEQEVLDEFYGK